MKSSIKKPVIILGCPRSGTTLLYTILGKSKELYSLYNESRFIFKKFYEEKLKEGIEFHDDALSPELLDDKTKEFFLKEFNKYTLNNRLLGIAQQKLFRKKKYLKAIDSSIVAVNQAYKDILLPEYRIIEKTPRNCFKVQFMNKLFPDAKFIYIQRDPRSNISSLIEGWRKRDDGKGRIPKLEVPLNIKGYDKQYWRFALPPASAAYADKSLEEVCAHQWISSNESIMNDLKDIAEDRQMTIKYEDLVANMPELIQKICEFTDLDYSDAMRKIAEKPPAINTIKGGKPNKDKWKRNADLIERVMPMLEETMAEMGYLVHV